MNTSTFIQTLNSNNGKNLQFELPDRSVIRGDLHITEVQHHAVDSVDCGGNTHSYNETVIQLLVNEQENSTAAWTTDKATDIIDIVGSKTAYEDDAELFIEYGDSAYPTIKYSVENIEAGPANVVVRLAVKPTMCKPKVNSGKQLAACC